MWYATSFDWRMYATFRVPSECWPIVTVDSGIVCSYGPAQTNQSEMHVLEAGFRVASLPCTVHVGARAKGLGSAMPQEAEE